MSAIHLSGDKFDEVISSGETVFVDFWATWCRPCQMMGPVIDELSEDFKGRAVVAKVDVDSNPEICERFGITNIPNFKVFKNGVEVANMVGAVPKTTVVNMLEKQL